MLVDPASNALVSRLSPPAAGFTRAGTTMSSRRWVLRIGKREGAGHGSPVIQDRRDIGGLLPTGTVTLLA